MLVLAKWVIRARSGMCGCWTKTWQRQCLIIYIHSFLLQSDDMGGVEAFTILCSEIRITKIWVSHKYKINRKHRWEISLYRFISVRKQCCLLPWHSISFPDWKWGEKGGKTNRKRNLKDVTVNKKEMEWPTRTMTTWKTAEVSKMQN